MLRDLIRIEAAWLEALVEHRIATATARVSLDDLQAVSGPDDADGIVAAAESGGNPVIPLVELL